MTQRLLFSFTVRGHKMKIAVFIGTNQCRKLTKEDLRMYRQDAINLMTARGYNAFDLLHAKYLGAFATNIETD